MLKRWPCAAGKKPAAGPAPPAGSKPAAASTGRLICPNRFSQPSLCPQSGCSLCFWNKVWRGTSRGVFTSSHFCSRPNLESGNGLALPPGLAAMGEPWQERGRPPSLLGGFLGRLVGHRGKMLCRMLDQSPLLGPKPAAGPVSCLFWFPRPKRGPPTPGCQLPLEGRLHCKRGLSWREKNGTFPKGCWACRLWKEEEKQPRGASKRQS